jgi:hypothetical protein
MVLAPYLEEEEEEENVAYLKGQCNEIFWFRFFSSIIFLQASENNNRVILPLVSVTLVMHVGLKYFRKLETNLMGYSGAWKKNDS